MAKLSHLSDLSALLSQSGTSDSSSAATQETSEQPQKKLGYDGKPQIVRIKAEKRSGGKIVTSITHFQEHPHTLEKMIGELRAQCGAGGRVLDNALEIQGDHSKKVEAFLQKRGYKTRMMQ